MFGIRNYDGLCVFMCRHPEVVEYITCTVSAAREWISKKQLQSITIVVFKTKKRTVIARYVYDIDMTGGGGGSSIDGSENITINESDFAALDLQLRAQVTRLMAVGGGRSMGEMANVESAATEAAGKEPQQVDEDDEVSFEVLVGTTGVVVPVDWVPVNGKEVWGLDGAIATPIKDGDCGCATVAVTSRVETDSLGDFL